MCYGLKYFITPMPGLSFALPFAQLFSFSVVTGLVLKLEINRDIAKELKASEGFSFTLFIVFFVASLLFGIAAIGV